MSAIEVPVEANAAQQIELTDMSENDGHRDSLYLFLCHLEGHNRRNLGAYQEFLAALDDNDYSIRIVAEVLLHRSSPRRREPTELSVETWRSSGPSFRDRQRLASHMHFGMVGSEIVTPALSSRMQSAVAEYGVLWQTVATV